MTTVRLTNYSLDRYGYKDLPRVCADYGFKKVVLVGGKKALGASEDLIRKALEGTDIQILASLVYGTDSTMDNVYRLKAMKEVEDADVIFAVGGGKAIDTSKVLGVEANKKVFTFPTICSNCSAATAIAVVYNNNGSFSHYDTRMVAPYHMFIATDVIAKAPDLYMWAGVGDGLSKEAEVKFATEGLSLDTTASLGLAIAKSCEKPFLDYGKKAIEDCKNKEASEAIERIATDVLISTGYVSNLTNSDNYYYNSSLAHAFYNATTSISREGNFEHGAIVAFGVMVLHAYREDEDELRKIGEFNKSVGLPTRLSHINLDESHLDKITEKAQETTEWQKSEKKLSANKFREAILKADEFGQTL